jgi:hypothetical protein
MQFKDFLTESFSKEYAYRIKFASDCGNDEMDMLEKCLEKYNFVSAAPWKRTPIQENPSEFVRLKGFRCTSEISSTDVVLKYPANPRILEVWLAVNMNLDHDRVLVYNVEDPRRAESERASDRYLNDKDRYAHADDSVLVKEDDQEHDYYREDVDQDISLYGEGYNDKFLAELKRIRDEKGADYFRAYPSKDEIMGDNLRPLWDELHNGTNMGKGVENKEVDVISQSARRN